MTRDKPSHDDVVYTPDWLADIMVRWLDVQNGMCILEPSCGKGVLINALLKANKVLEITAYDVLDAGIDYPNSVKFHHGAFMAQFAERIYDRAIMNPPFSNCGAWEFIKDTTELWLKHGGRCVSVFPNYMIDNAEGRKPWLTKWMRRYAIIPKNTFVPEVPVLHGGIGLFHQGEGCEFEFVSKAE